MREDREVNFTKSWRVLVDGVVVAHTPVRHGDDFAKQSCTYFYEHIKSAFDAIENGAEWDWVGYGGRMTAQEWIEHHENNLGMKLSSNVELVGPGPEYPLAPKAVL